MIGEYLIYNKDYLNKAKAMLPHKNCRLCDLAAGKTKYGEIDKPILETKDYLAVVSIGAFIEGWTLIIPKNHQLSCSPDYQKSDFLSFVSEVKKRVESIYGSTILFEHGANTEGSLTGCGVDHAHLHIVPFGQSIKEELDHSDLQWNAYHSNEKTSSDINGDYLLYVESISNTSISGLVAQPSKPVSQYFRRLLAKKSGISDQYDYKTHLFIGNSSKSYTRLTA